MFGQGGATAERRGGSAAGGAAVKAARAPQSFYVFLSIY
jgi:hypothetical protein